MIRPALLFIGPHYIRQQFIRNGQRLQRIIDRIQSGQDAPPPFEESDPNEIAGAMHQYFDAAAKIEIPDTPAITVSMSTAQLGDEVRIKKQYCDREGESLIDYVIVFKADDDMVELVALRDLAKVITPTITIGVACLDFTRLLQS